MTDLASAHQEARFIRNLQFLLTEGEFVNTYKFALLISLVRWALEHPDHDEKEPLDVARLSPYFAELYWPHVQPFGVAVPPPSAAAGAAAGARPPYGTGVRDSWRGVLVQDRGQWSEQQIPRVLKLIRSERDAGIAHLDHLPLLRRERLLREVAKSIRQMPLWKLHHVRDQQEPLRFLYRQGPTERTILFEPGIVACLAGFAPLVEEVVRSAWLRFVLRCNAGLLAAASQVEQFLFPGSRDDLEAWRPELRDLQQGQCFYCERAIDGAGVVDHFLPWSRYPRDLGHNFVLAHGACNGAKSDHLAAHRHLLRWCRRNAEQGARMAQHFQANGLPHDWPTLWQVARSLYRIADDCGAKVWVTKREFVPLDSEWESVLLEYRPAS